MTNLRNRLLGSTRIVPAENVLGDGVPRTGNRSGTVSVRSRASGIETKMFFRIDSDGNVLAGSSISIPISMLLEEAETRR